jgi:hypothetical protein
MRLPSAVRVRIRSRSTSAKPPSSKKITAARFRSPPCRSAGRRIASTQAVPANPAPRLGTVALGHLGWVALHRTISRTWAAAVLPGIIGARDKFDALVRGS